MRSVVVFLIVAFGLVSCDDIIPQGLKPQAKKQVTPDVPPQMRWDHKPQGKHWTKATMQALETHGARLVSVVPADSATWCPAYATASVADRRAFWSGLLSSLAKHESTYKQSAVGGGGRWFGLVQISPQTARGYGCAARSGAALKNGGANLSCAVRIMASTVSRDGVVSARGRGVAADWGPFHSPRKRHDMINWVSSQSYCKV